MTELHKPFGDENPTPSGFRPNTDYRKDALWRAFLQENPAIAESCIEQAKAWIQCKEFAGNGSPVIETGDALYKTVLTHLGITVNSTHPAAYTHAYTTLRGPIEAIDSGRIEVPEGSPLLSGVHALRTSEIYAAQILRNAALQEARSRFDQEMGQSTSLSR